MRPDSQDHVLLALWAADCAGHVLEAFEADRPQESRLRKAVEAVLAWGHGDLSMAESRAAACAFPRGDASGFWYRRRGCGSGCIRRMAGGTAPGKAVGRCPSAI
ncbi:putative immunity protein [Deinococcus sp. SM5_A1]|uniref:putative immunity protein n=1 Tax=Deinococcus sp. SM5_A1 TaxID=3379094 RepID=UPI00385A1D59